MLRSRWLSLLLASALASACGCSSMCNWNYPVMTRLTGFFRGSTPEGCCADGHVIDGPVIADPGCGTPVMSGPVMPGPVMPVLPTDNSGFTPLPQSSPPPLAQPRPLSMLRDTDRMPLQP